ncbi:unnamed protein product [Echinostoma caproni]|uniref:XPGN domain-containing protein n=1 Tax=Echinostoma caproni TaxID=27848 RepID=A0A183AR42_9TREM|nr:unnamed protein product [Echinostoma caproni]
MGVRGLSTYISHDPNSFTKYELHNTYLVFDAENYINHCYRNSGLARQFGGEYMDFAVYVRMFLKQLRRCRITPIFIFDGCHGKQVRWSFTFGMFPSVITVLFVIYGLSYLHDLVLVAMFPETVILEYEYL